jgi:hypothetical protein
MRGNEGGKYVIKRDHRGNGAGHLEACAVLAKIMPVFIIKLKQSCCEIGSFQRLLYLLRSFSSNKHMVASVSFVSTGLPHDHRDPKWPKFYQRILKRKVNEFQSSYQGILLAIASGVSDSVTRFGKIFYIHDKCCTDPKYPCKMK